MSRFTIYVALVLALLLIYIIGHTTYNLVFHPLARYPGPILGRLTNWYAVYHGYREDFHLDVLRCHIKYGSVVRYGPNRLLFNSSQGLKDIYGHNKNLRKATQYEVFRPDPKAVNTFSVIDKSVHGRKRRALNTGLSEAALKEYEPAILKNVDIFCAELSKDEHGSIISDERTVTKDMGSWTKFLLTFDIISYLAFGEDLHMLEDEGNRALIDAIISANKSSGIASQYPAAKKIIFMQRRIFSESRRYVKIISDILVAMANQRALSKSEGSPKDIYGSVMSYKDPENEGTLNQSEMIAEMALVIIAGSDSSGTAMSATLFYLSRHREAYQRVAGEVRKSFNSRAAIYSTSPALNKCRFLRACIDEAMRLCPPVTGPQWREVQSGGASIDGHFIPAGCDVGANSYAVHHNPANYPDPWDYRPERWLGDDAAVKQAQDAFCPFSLGPRGCVGKHLAYRVLMVALARIMFDFNFERPQGAEGKFGEVVTGKGWERKRIGEYQIKDNWTAHVQGPILKFRKR